ncbi:MAG TPA: L-threonylcarbamoyladenylate synthase [Pyrinomonadaceae bacterium]|nr:L-threonylcarbamoyladenylate synthase [Pyrinomonadaceae bacterium]
MTSSAIREDGEQTRRNAAELIQSGGVIAFRTDTFYGLGADPLNAVAVRRVRELKGREDSNPILLLISDESEVERFVEPSLLLRAVAAQHWPGAITLVETAKSSVPGELTANTQTLGIRLPADVDVRGLVHACGGALTATSANLSGQPPARSASEVASYFPNGIDLIIDGGEVTSTAPSTVLDVSGSTARLIREGVVAREALEEFL